MSNEFPELDQVEITVSESTRDRHRSAIASALRAQRRAPRGRGRILAFALALVLLIPVVALASQEAVPGDLLYPVKRFFEPVVQVFDQDVAAEHRVRELEILFERDAPIEVIDHQIDVAREVVTDRHPQLRDRIDRVILDLGSKRADVEDPARDEDRAPSDSTNSDTSDVTNDGAEGSDVDNGDDTVATTETPADDGRTRDG